jgi:hypothetical protein
MGKGKHSRPRFWERLTCRRPRLALRPPAPLEWVDLRSGITHLLTPEAAAAGRVKRGRYVALCGVEVIPAGMTEPGRGDCQPCRVAAIPGQRSQNTR